MHIKTAGYLRASADPKSIYKLSLVLLMLLFCFPLITWLELHLWIVLEMVDLCDFGYCLSKRERNKIYFFKEQKDWYRKFLKAIFLKFMEKIFGFHTACSQFSTWSIFLSMMFLSMIFSIFALAKMLLTYRHKN